MSIREQVASDMKAAMKAGDKARLGYARNLHAAIRKKEIDDKVELDDGAVQQLIGTLSKQRRDSIDQFTKGGREDLVDAEKAELDYLMSHMPQQMDEAEIRSIVEAAVKETGASDPKDMGKVMKVVAPKTQGRADGKLVSQYVRQALGANS